MYTTLFKSESVKDDSLAVNHGNLKGHDASGDSFYAWVLTTAPRHIP